MSPSEILRASFVTLIGIVLLFLVQPFLYQNGLAPRTGILIDGSPISVNDWLENYYFLAAVIVLCVSLASQVFWFFLATRFRGNERAAENRTFWWWSLFFVNLMGIGIALFLDSSKELFVSVALFFLIDMAIIYWLATAISTPGLLKLIPPGSPSLHSLLKF